MKKIFDEARQIGTYERAWFREARFYTYGSDPESVERVVEFVGVTTVAHYDKQLHLLHVAVHATSSQYEPEWLPEPQTHVVQSVGTRELALRHTIVLADSFADVVLGKMPANDARTDAQVKAEYERMKADEIPF